MLTRQALPVLDRSVLAAAEGLLKGAYVLSDPPASAAMGQAGAYASRPDLILIATGSEVPIALEAANTLSAEGIMTRVVSMPSWKLFEAEDAVYQESVLPNAVRARVAIEAGSSFGWERYVGDAGAVIGIDHLGASAPAEVLYREFGLTAVRVVEKAHEVLGR